MMLVSYNPWQEIDNLERRFNTLVEELVPVSFKDLTNSVKTPAAEMSETDDAIHLKLELPGMQSKDLDIQVTQNTVSISGERKPTPITEEDGNTRSEFYYGKFQRVISLPVQIQNTNVTADYKDGILHLTLPKQVAERNKVVKINLG